MQMQLGGDQGEQVKAACKDVLVSGCGIATAAASLAAEAGVGWQGAFCVLVLAIGLFLLISDRVRPELVMLGMLAVFMASGVVTAEKGLEGFSNTGIATVAVLFVIAAGVSATGGLDHIMGKVLGSPVDVPTALLRMMAPVGGLSCFVNNTPICIITLPVVLNWSRKLGLPPQQLLMPLSFAALMGGTVTVVGTSANLVVAGLQRKRYADPGSPHYDPSVAPMGIFDLTPYGLPVALWGCMFMAMFAPLLLPGAKKGRPLADDEDDEQLTDFMIGLVVPRDSPVANRTVEAAGLRGLDGLFLVAVRRGQEVLHAVGREFFILPRDVLYFTGLLDRVQGQLLDPEGRYGLQPYTDDLDATPPSTARQSLDGNPASRQSIDGPAASRLENLVEEKSSYCPPTRGPASWPHGKAVGPEAAAAAEGKGRRGDDGAAEDGGSGNGNGNGGSVGMPSVHQRQARSESLTVPLLQHQHQQELVPSSSSSPRHACTSPGPLSSRGSAPWAAFGCMAAGGSGSSRRQVVSRGPPQLVQATVREGADIVGRTIKEVGFRNRFHAAIVAVRRGGRNLVGVRLGQIQVEAGDVILMTVAPPFWRDQEGKGMQATFEAVAKAGADGGGIVGAGDGGDGGANGGGGGGSMGREFMLPMEVKGLPLSGRTIEAAGLRGLPDCFLVSLEREGDMIHAVAPSETLREGDILWFSCLAQSVSSIRRVPGLVPHTNQVDKLSISPLDRRLVQAVVAAHSPLAGKTIKDVRFRTTFDAAVVAVHRQGDRIRAKVGDIAMQAGDVLLLDTGPHFMAEHSNGPHFALISEIADSAPPRFDKFLIAVGASVAAFALSAAGVLELVTSLMLAAGVMLASGCLSREQAMAAVRWDVVLMIGAAFGISTALQESGIASSLASLLVAAGQRLGGGSFFTLAALYFATALTCQVVSNNAAAALMFPIAANVADKEGLDSNVVAYCLMLAASSCYMTPFSYATNLMVYAAGGYRPADFLRFGGPLQVWQASVTLLMLLAAGWLPIAWLVTGVASLVVFTGLPLRGWYLRRGQRQRSTPSLATTSIGPFGRATAPPMDKELV